MSKCQTDSRNDRRPQNIWCNVTFSLSSDYDGNDDGDDDDYDDNVNNALINAIRVYWLNVSERVFINLVNKLTREMSFRLHLHIP